MQTSQQTRTVDGIKFTRGENNTQIYWETEHRRIYYGVIQPKGCKHWIIVAQSLHQHMKILNGSAGTPHSTGPLYFHHELTLDGWLSELADYLNNL